VTAGSITLVPGIRVGHWTDPVGLTGCTVVLCPAGTVASGEVRGGAPGTRETDLLRPGTLVQEVNAVLLTGGSAFGLAAADGVVRWLEERGIGFDAGVARVPIVPAAVLFDLGAGDPKARPGPDQGYAACEAAGEAVEEGNAGAGTGATVAKSAGPAGAMKGGVGTSSRSDGDLVVGALAAVNALGDILDESGDVLAGARTVDEGTAGPPSPSAPTNTTLVVVATNARLSKERCRLLSLAGHEGISASIRPAHTMWDGDTVFALATGPVDGDQRRLEALATEAVGEAIRRGVLLAGSVPGFPSVREGREHERDHDAR
jgi:L-aminopeptidase/D-esterase-like protein